VFRPRQRWPLAAVLAGAALIIACSAGLATEGVSVSVRGDDRSAAVPSALRDQSRVQPTAREFLPPYGKPDVSPQSARAVDQLYEELMRQARSSCIDARKGSRSERC
jgi:hypothetical protein